MYNNTIQNKYTKIMTTLTSTSELTETLKGCTGLNGVEALENGDVILDFCHTQLEKQDKYVQATINIEYMSCTDVYSLGSHIVDENDFFINELLNNTIQTELSIKNY